MLPTLGAMKPCNRHGLSGNTPLARLHACNKEGLTTNPLKRAFYQIEPKSNEE